MASGETHEISTFEDMVRLYSQLPAVRGDLLLKEVCDAVRMLAPMAGLVSLSAPLRWVDSDGGTATLNLSAAAGQEPLATVKVKLPGGGL